MAEGDAPPSVTAAAAVYLISPICAIAVGLGRTRNVCVPVVTPFEHVARSLSYSGEAIVPPT